MRAMITKEQAIALFGSVKALQAALGLKTHSAIYMWKDGEPIPEAHELRLRYQLKPEAFGADGNLIAQPPAQGHEPVRRCTAAPETGDAAETAPPVPMKKVA